MSQSVPSTIALRRSKDSLPTVCSELEQRRMRDLYLDNRRVGHVVGTTNDDGITRRGVDVEGCLSIDNGALRLAPLLKSGWNRAGITYGPFRRENGLAFATFILNGHNTSQTGSIPDTYINRLKQWARGSGTKHEVTRRLWRLPWSRQAKFLPARLYRWYRMIRFPKTNVALDENLAVGWFATDAPLDPSMEGNAFVVHATGAKNGELWASVGLKAQVTVDSLQNLQVFYVIILREKGAAYYAASLANNRGLGEFPNMRPLAIDPFRTESKVYASIFQSVLGQIGFRVDTRVYGTQVEHLSELATWYGTAQVADSLGGIGKLESSKGDHNAHWVQILGDFRRTAQGAVAAAPENLAVVTPQSTSGLIHLLIDNSTANSTANDSTVGIVWRAQDKDNYWYCTLDRTECRLHFVENGNVTVVAVSDDAHLYEHSTQSLQIVDDGNQFRVQLDGVQVFNAGWADNRLASSHGVGIYAKNADSALCLRHFEAHPRSIPIPESFQLGVPWQPTSTRVVVNDCFSGEAGDLVNTSVDYGDRHWRKEIGIGAIWRDGNNAAQVQASVHVPNPGRTAYTVAWEHTQFADLEVELVPPGTQRGQGEHGRGGLLFWQDADNYIIINTWLDDHYGGASVSSFFRIDGFEEIYDAVWTNVGDRITWGKPYRLRANFDGMNYLVSVDGEPVLYRALTDVYPDLRPLKIKRVGIVANWEWGNDTGTIFRNFTGRV